MHDWKHLARPTMPPRNSHPPIWAQWIIGLSLFAAIGALLAWGACQ